MRVPWQLWDQVWERDAGFCRYCNVDLSASFNLWMSATVDHVIAVSAGGPSNIKNLVLCCAACNSMLSRAGDLQTIDERKTFLDDRRPDFESRYQSYRRHGT
jgi:5-methylcytosine-specific restriction endonuclease McrA